MAEQAHTVDLGDDELLDPWGTVIEIAAATDTTGWVLVGGLMVQLHARRAGVAPPRPTKDVDLVVDVAARKVSASTIAIQLQGIGFIAEVPASKRDSVYRFRRGKEQVDIMVPDHLPPSLAQRLMQRPAFEAPAGEQSVRRRDTYLITTSTSGEFTLQVPNSLGALVGKGAAHLIDQRDRERHLQDGAVLFASIESVGGMDLTSLTKNDRKRLRHLIVELGDSAEAWDELDPADARRGRQNRDRLQVAANL